MEIKELNNILKFSLLYDYYFTKYKLVQITNKNGGDIFIKDSCFIQ